MRNYHKLDMASAEWLTTHFIAKSASRHRDFSDLPIFVGARVLDLCCGPGLFIPYLLDLVGPTGSVTGVDHDPVSLDVAHRRLTASPHRNWHLSHSSAEEYLPHMSEYDIVLLFNSIGYFEKPFELIKEIANRLRAPAKIIVKDFDLESFFFQPRDPTMWSQLIESAKQQNDADNPVRFDNFFGRRVVSLHHAYHFRSSSNCVWTQMMTFPFNDYEREYIWRNIECLIKQAGPSCPTKVADYFKAMFYPPTSTFFDEPEAVFIETEFLTSLER